MAHRPSNVRRNEWTVGLLALERNARVLEWGCGPGLGIKACLRQAPDGFVFGVDHSQVMIAQARKRNQRALRQGRVQIELGSLEAAAEAAPFDAVFSCNVLQFNDEIEALRNMYALLTPGGVAANTFQPRNPNASTRQTDAWASRIAAACEVAGFEGIEIRRLELRPAAAACVLARRPG